ncbi:TIM barrel protein [Palleronia sp. KMU-117]|uniref:TIM barrel protein n=1 Tax=Palleronia sp. KMU-117 TaxID=3434108 RepID=UPI003D704663
MRLSANTGYLFTDLPFPDRIRAAANAGFDAVEFHDEVQSGDADTITAALAATGLPVLSLNVRMGPGFGCAALPGREATALGDFRDALAAAEAVDARAIHVMAGTGEGSASVFAANLARFADLTDRTVLVEPISQARVPGYVLSRVDDAARLLDTARRPNLGILMDVYHVLAEGDDPADLIARHGDRIAHVQIASFPSRGAPGGEGPDYRALIPALQAARLDALGCEYHPGSTAPDAAALRQAIGL